MPTRSAKAEWHGSMQAGNGTLQLAIGNYPYSFKTRMDESNVSTTNPEEMIAAAQATCYSMALSARLNSHGHIPEKIETTCKVTLSPSGLGLKISRIVIVARAKVANMDESTFKDHAQVAKDTCPISLALAAVNIVLDAALME
jgi:osmotically inducible protein OsmC